MGRECSINGKKKKNAITILVVTPKEKETCINK
jgi:hypothetical protein